MSQVDEVLTLDCPQCGTANEESEQEELVFNCSECLQSYDLAVCQHCNHWFGSYFGDDGTCPNCGELHYEEV